MGPERSKRFSDENSEVGLENLSMRVRTRTSGSVTAKFCPTVLSKPKRCLDE
jgi:hypothetical protein